MDRRRTLIAQLDHGLQDSWVETELAKTEKRPLLTRHAVLILCRDQSYPIDRLIADTGFRPTVGVEEGIRRTLQWLTSDEGLAEVANG